jgi:Ca-activated chloride channel homolog
MTKRLLILLGVAMLLPLILATSQAKGNLGGVVSNEKGEPLSGAGIECFFKTQMAGSAESDANGNYLIKGLAPGKYRIEAKLEGYEPWEKNNVSIASGKTKTVNIKLKAIIIEEIVTENPVLTTTQMNHQSANASMPAMELKAMQGGMAYCPPPGSYSTLLPPDWNTEDYNAITPNIFHSPLVEPLSTFSIDVDTATYSNVRRMLNQNMLPAPNTIRTEEIVNYFDYDYPEPHGEHPFSVYTEFGVCPWNQKRDLIHIGIQGKRLDMCAASASNLVFLLDVSGSMDEPNKLPLVKQAMSLLVENMRPKDRISIVTYSDVITHALPSASGEDKGKIFDAINALQAGGSTAGGAAIQMAYNIAAQNFIKSGNNRIILCTDGDFNIGASSDAEMTKLVEDNRKNGVFLTVLGFGMGNYKDNRLELLADKGNGNYAYIDDISEAKKVLVNEMGGTLFTIAKDVKIQVEFNPAHVKAYRLIGYENRLLNAEDFKDDTKDAGELGAGASVTAIYEIIPMNSKEEIPGVDLLKYQSQIVNEEAQKSPELCTVKMRYKLPDGDKSIPLETPVYNKTLGMEDVSKTFLFSCAAVGYAMLLQNSEYKAALTWDMVRQLATENMGDDKDGYRRDFLKMITKAETLMRESQPEKIDDIK